MTRTPTRRRLVQGRDYHGWAWEDPTLGLSCWADTKPGRLYPETNAGRWVRVKFVRVGVKTKRRKS